MKIIFEMDAKEKWKKIKGKPYKISNFGRVKRNKPERRTYIGKILKPCIDRYGYLHVGLSEFGKQKTYLIHKLVAQAFIGPCPKDKEVNHMDGDKENPCVDNLEYITKSENCKHSFRMGLLDRKGENNSRSKLTETDVKEIIKIYNTEKYFQWEIAEIFKIHRGQISKIVNRKAWDKI